MGLSNELEIEKGECIILESCQDKENLLAYFDVFFKPDYSAQLNYGSIEVGAFYSEKQNGKLIPNPNHGEQSADDFRMKNAPYGIMFLTQNEWDNYVEMEPRAKLRLERLEMYIKPYTYPNAKPIPALNYTEEELKQLNVSESSLGNNILNWMIKGITGSKPSYQDWEKFISENKNSIDNVIMLNQRAYDRYLQATK